MSDSSLTALDPEPDCRVVKMDRMNWMLKAVFVGQSRPIRGHVGAGSQFPKP